MAKVIFQCMFHETVECDINVALQMSPKIREKLGEMLRGYEHEGERDQLYPLPNIRAPVMKLIISWYEYHQHDVQRDPTLTSVRDSPFNDPSGWCQFDIDFKTNGDMDLLHCCDAAIFLRMKYFWEFMFYVLGGGNWRFRGRYYYF